MKFFLAVIEGDGVGPELVASARRLLTAVTQDRAVDVQIHQVKFGNQAVSAGLTPSDEERLRECANADAILLGNVWLRDLAGTSTPQKVNAFLGQIRRAIHVYANLRPVVSYEALRQLSPLKKGPLINTVVIREMAAGMLNPPHELRPDQARDYEQYDGASIRRVGQLAFGLAAQRRRRLCHVDKAIVLASSQLWRKVLAGLAPHYPRVHFSNCYVDDVAARLINEPGKFDVVLTTGMFGDILADELAALTGTANLLPSIELGRDHRVLYTTNQLHNNDEQIVGTGMVNPLGMLATVAWLVRMTLQQPQLADRIEKAINDFINQFGEQAVDQHSFTTEQITNEIIKRTIKGVK